MASSAYPFIDIAVLDAVRMRFALGDALAILSSDLATVLWANGAGAGIFGYPDIEAIMGAPAQLGLAARRQIAATPGFPIIGRDKGVVVRLSSGLTSRAVAFLASSIVLPGGEQAILLASPEATAASRSPSDIAERALAGFSEAGYFAALVDEAGGVTASTAGFAALGIEQEALRALCGEVRGEHDRLVKRLVRAGAALFPAGFARLTDDPRQHLLVVVDEDQSADGAATDARESDQNTRAAPVEQDNQRSPPASPPAVEAETVQAGGARAMEAASPAQIDRWYFHTGEEEDRRVAPVEAEPAAQPAEPIEIRQPPSPPQRPAAPVRFVWKTDAEGRFSAISADFTAAVRADAADLIGRRFRDVASALGFDAEGEISGLLERRDTWSGRSVLWPITGTGLRTPVDLAALPVYGRDRSFEGFRGFGVARLSDAAANPEAPISAPVVSPPARGEADTAPAEEEPVEETPETGAAEDPFRGEVPALAIDDTPARRFADKVIRLAEHRPPTIDRGLTPVERIAFREIGDRLKKDGAAAPFEPDSKAAPETSEKAVPLPPLPDLKEPKSEAAEVEREEAEAALAEESFDDAGALEPVLAAEPVLDAATEADPIPIPAAGENGHAGSAEATDDDAIWPEAAHSDEPPGAFDDEPAVAEAAIYKAVPAPAAETISPVALPEERPGFDLSILARLPVPVLIHSGDRLHYANREFLHFTGYESLAVLEQAGGLDALFAEPYEPGVGDATSDHKLRLRTQDGGEFPVEALLQRVAWSPGKALLLAIRPVAPHLLEASAATEDLEARISELRAILDTATDGVVLITNEGVIRSISRPAEALFGFDQSEVAERPFTSLFAVESQRAAQDYLNGLSDNGVASVLNDGREVIGREAQGRFIPLFMTIGRLPGDSGYCAVLRDITQWKRAEEELTQARAQAERTSSHKTDFLARVSHEIRTPLNAIIGFSELMVDEKFGPISNDRYRDYLRDINRSGNHVLDLVNDLLDISKIEAGEQEMSYEAVSLNDALAECVAMLQPQANRERVIIRSSFASRLPEVVADMRSIRQIALNLFSNAIRYTPAGGQVIVSTAYETTGDIVMRVRDTGIGMTHAEIEQALKPFKQINALKRARGDGTGLGLPLTKAMVEANRARFSINSTPGEGTMVEITFPSTRVLAD